MSDNENSTSSYVALNHDFSSCKHFSIVLLTYNYSGDHRVTGVHGSNQQGESLPTIYPKIKCE